VSVLGGLAVQTPAGELEPERVRAALDDVLADERFRENPLLAWLSDLLERIGDFLSGSGGGGGFSDFLAVLGWVVLGLVLVALVMLIVSRLRRRSRPLRVDPPVADVVAERVAELLAAAREAEQAGDLLLALRLYFFALVVGLGKRGELRYRDAWTNRELLERGRPSASVRTKLAPIVRDLDRKSFGGERVDEEDVRRLKELCSTWLTRGGVTRVARSLGGAR